MMGRKRNIFVREFFHYDTDTSVCTCKTCGCKLQGAHVSNLKQHMTQNHLDIYTEEMDTIKEQENNRSICAIRKSISIKLSAEEVTNACVQLVTIQSQPLKLFDCNAFTVLTKQIFEGLDVPVITSANIMNYVSEKYSMLKNVIKKACKGRMVSIKMDTATRHDRAVLGINVQLIKDNKIVIYTLAMQELTERHTADNLKEELENVLIDFEIGKKQIYTITTDNGRNMVKAVELFSTESAVEGQVEEEDEYLNMGSSVDEQFLEDLEDNLCSEEQKVVCVKCAAHTLQLAVKDFLAENKMEIIDRAREVVKTLRTPKFRYSLQHLCLKKPRIDVLTRWNSTFDMLQRLLEHKDSCQENLKKPLLLSEEEWLIIQDLVKVLSPSHDTSIKLQKIQLFLGDFYKLWLNLKVQLKSTNSTAAAILLQCLNKRELQLLENEAVNAALFLDPRLKRLLGSEQKAKAKKHLKKMGAQMLLLKQGDITINEVELEASCDDTIVLDAFASPSSTSFSLLRESIGELEVESSSDNEPENFTSPELVKLCSEVDNYKEKRIDIDADLMEYWKNKKYMLPYVAKLAYIVHGVPATQVSVERAFSALKVMLDDRRTNLSPQNLQKLLFVKLNTDVMQ